MADNYLGGQGLRVALIGATGAVGRELITMLETAPFRVAELLPMASERSTVPGVEFKGRMVTTGNVDLERIQECDLAILAVPPGPAWEIGNKIIPLGCPIVDISGVLGVALGAPRIVADASLHQLDAIHEIGAVVCPSPAVMAASALLAPFRGRFLDLRCRLTVMHSAASRGRDGIRELSGQVAALFNSRSPPTNVFPGGLAFDMQPSTGPHGVDGWTEEETGLAEQVGQIIGIPASNLAATCVVAPWFTGLAMIVHLAAERHLDARLVFELLENAAGIKITGNDATTAEIPRPRSSMQEPSLSVARVRDDPMGEGVHLWAVADEIRYGVARNTLKIMAALLERDLL